MEIVIVKMRKERGRVVKRVIEVKRSLLVCRIVRESKRIFKGEIIQHHNDSFASNIVDF